MKMKSKHYNRIAEKIARVASHDRNAPDRAKGVGWTGERFRWSAYRAAMIDGDSDRWTCDVLYPYLNDTHIDTALRKATAAAWPDHAGYMKS